jgi:hypothetical protein
MEEINIIEEVKDNSIENKKEIIKKLIQTKGTKINDEIEESLKINTFFTLIERDEESDKSRNVPNILEVAIKHLILLNYNDRALNTAIIPQILLPKQFVKKGGLDSIIQGDKHIQGGLIKKFIPKINAQIGATQSHSIGRVSFNVRIRCYFAGKTPTETFILPKDVPVEIIGLHIVHNPSKQDTINNCCSRQIQIFKEPYLEMKKGIDQVIFSLVKRGINWIDHMRRDYPLCLQAIMRFQAKTAIEQHNINTLQEVATNDILLELEKIGWYKFANNTRATLGADLFALGIDKLYHNYDKSTIHALIDAKELRAKQHARFLNIQREQSMVDDYKALIRAKLKKDITKAYSTVDELIASLSNQEQALIKAEMKKRNDYERGLLENKCPHLSIKISGDSFFVKQKESLTKLKEFFVKDDKADTIMCNTCHFPIMCRHSLEVIEGRLANKPIDVLRADMSKLFKKDGINYVCQICFEHIAEIEDTDVEIPPSPEELDQDLVDRIMNEIYRLRRYITTGKVPIKKIANIVYLSCYPQIVLVNKSLKRNKVLAEREYHRRLSLYIDIYIFAYFIKLSQQGHLTIVNPTKDAKNKANKANVKRDPLEESVAIINDYANIIIRESIDINANWIKHKLAEIIKSVSLAQSNIKESVSIDDSIIAKSDYTVRYCNSLRFVAGLKPVNAPEEAYHPFALKYDTKQFYALSAQISSITQLANKYGLKMTKNKGAISKVSAPTKDIYLAYITTSAKQFYDSIKYDDKVAFLKEVKKDIVLEYSESYIELMNKRDLVSSCERVLLRYRDMLNLKPIGYRILQVKREKARSPLGRIYDTEGRPHQFKYNLEKKDYYCDICKMWRADASKVDDAVIRDALIRSTNKRYFFKMFEMNCPLGGVHTMVNGLCQQCGFHKFVSDEQKEEYYKKYQSEFKIMAKKEKRTTEWFQIYAPVIADRKEYDGWAFNFKSVIEFADKMKINPKLIMTLGDYDGNNYDKIKTGEHVPAVVEYKNNTRIVLIKAYFKLMITMYNQLRFSNLGKPKPDILKIIEESAIQREIRIKLDKVLPPVHEKYYDNIRYFQVKKPAEMGVEFIIQQLIGALTDILNDPNKDTEQLRAVFVRTFMEKIMRGSYLRTEYAYFNFSLLYGEKGEKSTDKIHNADEYKQMDENAEEDDEIAPMSLDGFDVEGDEDGENDQTMIRTDID